ncbi:hypothetical protein KAT36_03820 [Candidatus Pacearchaeota archaeon]|nr:hypothetical protein [Candidatus Pacearchaeota archaeon]
MRIALKQLCFPEMESSGDFYERVRQVSSRENRDSSLYYIDGYESGEILFANYYYRDTTISLNINPDRNTFLLWAENSDKLDFAIEGLVNLLGYNSFSWAGGWSK